MKIPHLDFVKKAFMLGTGNAIGQAIAFVFFVLLARWMSRDDYGEIRYIISLSSVLGTVALAGLPASMTRFLAYQKEKEEREKYFTNIMTLFFMTLMIMGLIVIALFSNSLTITIVLMGFTVPLIYLGAIRGLMQYRKYSIFQALRNLIKLAFLFAIFYTIGVKKLPVLLIYSFAGWGAMLILELVWPAGMRFTPGRISKDVMKRVIAFSIPVMGTTIAYSLFTGLPVLLTTYYKGYESAAVYSTAFTFTAIYSLVPTAILTMIMPKIASIRDKESRMQIFKSSVYLILMAGALLFIATVFFGKWGLNLLFHSKYDSSYMPLVILSLGTIFLSVRGAYSALWEGGGRPIISTYDGVGAVTVMAMLGPLIIPSMGANGAALAFTAGCITAVIISTYFWMQLKKGKIELK